MYIYRYHKAANRDYVPQSLFRENPKDVREEDFHGDNIIRVVYKNGSHMEFDNYDDYAEWYEGYVRNMTWYGKEMKQQNESIAKAVDPSHYKDYIDGHQWVDAMSKIPRFRDPGVFKGALELQIRKYLDRNGRKDNEIQELGKALFYLAYLLVYTRDGSASAKDIHEAIKGI